MREIKFRAWVATHKAMFKDIFNITFGSTVIHFQDKESNSAFAVHPDFFMQYTGLKDKNGKEIYERDICRTYRYPEDDDGWARLSENNREYYNVVIEYMEKTPFCGFVVQDWFEVIGNIYENPELLEASHETI